MAACDKYTHLISAALDGELSAADRAALDAHLTGCPQCRELMEQLSQLHDTLSQLPPAPPPPGLKDDIMAALAASAAPASRHSGWRRGLAWAAVLTLVLTAAWRLGRPGSVSNDAAPEGALTVEGADDDSAAGAESTIITLDAAMPESAFPTGTGGAPQNAATTFGAVGDAGAVKESGAALALSPALAPVAGTGSTEQYADSSAKCPPLCSDNDPAQPRLFTAQSVPPLSWDIPEQSVASQSEAVIVLTNYIYELAGEVQLVEDGLAMNYTVNSPTGVSGTVACVGEDEEVYFLNYQDSLSPGVLNYSVRKDSGHVTLLSQEPPAALPEEVMAVDAAP